MSEYRSLVSNALNELNNRHDGDTLFENVAIECMKTEYSNYSVHASSGLAAGGDGKIDGYFCENPAGRHKIACSIRQDCEKKIKEELINNPEDIVSVIFCTNQPIPDKQKLKIVNAVERPLRIFELEDLIDLVMKTPEAQRLLGIPIRKKRLSKEILKEHNQRKATETAIRQYITRYVYDADGSGIAIEIYKYVASWTTEVLIIRGDAGTGKTGVLEQLYVKILDDDEICNLPPFIITLKNYKDGLLSDVVNKVLAEHTDLECPDYILLLDGLDEMSESSMEQFVQELNLLFNLDQSREIRAIITVRSGWYGLDKLKTAIWKDKCNTVDLKELSHEDVYNLVSSTISQERMALISTKLEGLGYSDNIFFVTNAIKLLLGNNEQNLSTMNLLHAISEIEVTSQVRGNGTISEYMQLIAANIELSQRNECYVEIGGIRNKIKFSHRIIQEYLCAKYLSERSLQEIVQLISVEGYILPNLYNVVGFLLNCLLEAGKSDVYDKLFDFLSERSSNIFALLKIDYHYIYRDQIVKLLRQALDYYPITSEGPSIEIAVKLQSVWDEIGDEIVDMLNSKERIHFAYYALSCYFINLAEEPKKKISSQILSLFINAIVKRDFFITAGLSYLMIRLRIDVLSDTDEHILVSFMVSKDCSEQLYSNLCYFLFENKITLSENDCNLILNRYLKHHEDCFYTYSKTTSQIGNEDEDVYSHSTWFDGFYFLLEYFISENVIDVYSFFKRLIEIYSDGKIRFISTPILTILGNKLASEVCTDKENLKAHEEDIRKLFDKFYDEGQCRICSIIITKLLDNTDDVLFLLSVIGLENLYKYNDISCIKEPLVNDESFLRKYIEFFKGVKGYSLNYMFLGIGFKLDDVEALNQRNLFPSEWKSDIDNYIRQCETVKEQERKKHNSVFDYQILFDFDVFNAEVIKYKAYLDEEDMNKKFSLFNNTNRYIWLLYRNGVSLDDDSLLRKIVSSPDYENYRVCSVIDFICTEQQPLDAVFSEEEVDQLILWTVGVINDERILIESNLLWECITQVLRCHSYIDRLNSKIEPKAKRRLLKLIDHPFPVKMRSGVSFRYDELSIEYLTEFVDKKDIAEYIILNIETLFKDEVSATVAIGFLSKHKNDVIVSSRTPQVRHKILGMINEGSLLYSSSEMAEYVMSLDIHYTDIKDSVIYETLKNQVEYDLDRNLKKYNVLNSLLGHGNYLNKDDIDIIGKEFIKLFEAEYDILKKKTYAEYAMQYAKNDSEAFIWYSEYLISDPESKISYKLKMTTSCYASTSMNVLPELNNLVDYCIKHKNSNKSEIIFSLVEATFRAIAGEIISSSDFSKLLEAVDDVISKQEWPWISIWKKNVSDIYISHVKPDYNILDNSNLPFKIIYD